MPRELPTSGQVQSAIKRFKDYSNDLLRADMTSFEDRLRQFADFAAKDAVFSRLNEQLLHESGIQFDKWMETQGDRHRIRHTGFHFPTNPELRTAVQYQFVMWAAEPGKNIIGQLPTYFVSGSNRVDSYIRKFAEVVMEPLFRELTYKLQDIEDTLPDSRSEYVTENLLRIVTAGPIHVDRRQTINFNGAATNFQIGEGNTQHIQLQFSIAQLTRGIDESTGSENEKNEAKGLLEKFLEHPLTSTVVAGLIAATAK